MITIVCWILIIGMIAVGIGGMCWPGGKELKTYERGVLSGQHAIQNPEITPESIEAAGLHSMEHMPEGLDFEEQRQWLQGRIDGAKGNSGNASLL